VSCCSHMEQDRIVCRVWCVSHLYSYLYGRAVSQEKVYYKLDVHESVHRDTVMRVTNKIQLYRLIYYSKSALHVSGYVFSHNQEHLTVFTVFLVFTQVAAGWCHGWVATELCGLWGVQCTPHNPHSSVATHPWHQPAATWVNTIKYCKYSQVLLIMGENIARNM